MRTFKPFSARYAASIRECWPGLMFSLAALLFAGGACASAGGDVHVPTTASVDEFIAVIVRVCWDGTFIGAVYRPLVEMLPEGGLTDQVMLTPKGRF